MRLRALSRTRSAMSEPKRVLVVGAGQTAAAVAYYSAPLLSNGSVRLTVWDKARGPGGRFSTVRSRQHPILVDHGAQYITRGAGREPDAALYHELLSNGILQPFTGVVAGSRAGHNAQEHFVCRDGMSSIARHLLAGVSAIDYERRAISLEHAPGAARWRVTDTEGRADEFDAVVVTVLSESRTRNLMIAIALPAEQDMMSSHLAAGANAAAARAEGRRAARAAHAAPRGARTRRCAVQHALGGVRLVWARGVAVLARAAVDVQVRQGGLTSHSMA